MANKTHSRSGRWIEVGIIVVLLLGYTHAYLSCVGRGPLRMSYATADWHMPIYRLPYVSNATTWTTRDMQLHMALELVFIPARAVDTIVRKSYWSVPTAAPAP